MKTFFNNYTKQQSAITVSWRILQPKSEYKIKSHSKVYLGNCDL